MLNYYIIGALAGIGAAFSFFFITGKGKRSSEGGENNNNDDIKNTSFLLSGSLKQTSLLEAMQFLQMGKREGILHIYTGKRKGYIAFRFGGIVDASYRDASGEDAVELMLGIKEGDFYFEPCRVSVPRVVFADIMDFAFIKDEQEQMEQ